MGCEAGKQKVTTGGAAVSTEYFNNSCCHGALGKRVLLADPSNAQM